MDYITRYYKNLSEQLQAQTNQLKRILTEMEAANLQTFNVEFDATPQGDYNQADSGLQPVMAGTNNYDPNKPRFGGPGIPIRRDGKPQYGYIPAERYVIVAPDGRYFILTGNPAKMYGPFNPTEHPSGIGNDYPTNVDLGPAYWTWNPNSNKWQAPGGDHVWSPDRWYYS